MLVRKLPPDTSGDNTHRHVNCFFLICWCGPRHVREKHFGRCLVSTPVPKQGCCLETLDSCIRWPHHWWQKFWTIQSHIQVQHCGRGWQGLQGWSNQPTLPRLSPLPISSDMSPRQSSRKKKKFSGGFRGVSALESEVSEPVEVDPVSDEIRRWSNLSEDECQCFVSAEDISTVPTVPSTRTRTRTEVGDLDWGQVGGWMRRSELCVRETSLSFIKITQSLIY